MTVTTHDLDIERLSRYIGRMVEKAGWPAMEGYYIGHKPQDDRWTVFASDGPVHGGVTFGSTRRLSVVVPSRDLDSVPSPVARVSADMLRGVRRALS